MTKLNKTEKTRLLDTISLGAQDARYLKDEDSIDIDEKTKIDDEVIAQNFEAFVDRGELSSNNLFHFLLKIGFDYNFPIQYRCGETTLKEMIESRTMPYQENKEEITAFLAERERLTKLDSQALKRYVHEEECFLRFLKKSYWLKKSQEKQKYIPTDRIKLRETLKNMSGALGPSKETTKLMRNVVKQFKAKKQKEKQ